MIEQEPKEGEAKFWMIWRPQAGQPQKKHDTIESARTEANRLAQANPTKCYFILEGIERYQTSFPPVETVELK